MKYKDRIVESQIDDLLESTGAILIEGARWCGKTCTAEKKSASSIYMLHPDHRESYIHLAHSNATKLLSGDAPRLIDEWQIAPILWDAIKYTVDQRGKTGQFILTGSAVPPEDNKRHSGAGRFSRLLMRPMSLFESGESDGSVSLGAIFESPDEINGFSDFSVDEISALITRGGWPELLGKSEKAIANSMDGYVSSIVNVDISRVDGINRNPAMVRKLLQSLSRNISTMASMTTIQKDMAGDDSSISDKTVSDYINSLRRIFVVESLPAWNPILRSKTAIRTSSKHHFVDPSIAMAAIGISSSELVLDFKTLGILFESLCIRDLRVYAQAIGGEVFHYRDRNDLEADAIIHLRGGRWGAIEIKLGQRIDEGAENLIKLKSRIDLDRMRPPSFLMVITSTGYAYRRSDGVLVVPIGCLKH